MLNNTQAGIAKHYWVLGVAQVVHSIEETYTKLYLKFGTISETLHQEFPWIPHFEISADVFAILNMLMIALMLGSVPTAEKGTRIALVLMWSWAIIELMNGTFHIGSWLYLHHYFPGGVSGPILVVLSIQFIKQFQTTSNDATQAIQ